MPPEGGDDEGGALATLVAAAKEPVGAADDHFS
jgi:hypothetical protein